MQYYSLLKNNYELYTCFLSEDQAEQANRRFSQLGLDFIFIVPTPQVKSSNHESWITRYTEDRGIARYPFDLILTQVLRYRSHLPKDYTPKAFDFGYGGGNHLWMLAKEGFDVHGIDIDESVKESALSTTASFGVDVQERQILTGNLTRLHSLESSSFDVVIDRQTLVQLSYDNAKQYVSEFHRILKEFGVYIGLLFADTHSSIKFGDYLSDGLYKSFDSGPFSGMGQRQFYSLSRLRDLFTEYTIEGISLHELRPIIGNICDNAEYLVVARKS